MLSLSKVSTCSLLCLTFLFNAPVYAQNVMDWQEEEGGRIRISFDGAPRDGKAGEVYGLIEVELEAGWKTYWQEPGSSGLAPELDVTYVGADKIKLSAQLLFPAPARIDENKGGGWIYGYQNRVNLPFRLNLPMKTGKIFGTLLIGLCYDICLPTQLDFAFDVSQQADFLIKGRIEAAMAALPQPAVENFSITRAIKQGEKLIVTLNAPDGQFLNSKPLEQFRKSVTRFCDKNCGKNKDLEQSAEPSEAKTTLDLFIHTQAGQLELESAQMSGTNEFSYQFKIISGKLVAGDKIDYIIKGRPGYTVSGVQLIE